MFGNHARNAGHFALQVCFISALMPFFMTPIKALAATCAEQSYPAQPASFLRSYRDFFNTPTRLAIDSEDNVYILDPRNGRVVKRAPSGLRLGEIKHPGYPISLAIDSVGSLYVGDGELGRIDVFNPAGEILGFLGQGDQEFGQPAYLAVLNDLDGPHVFVSDRTTNRISRYHGETSTQELVFGGTGSAAGQLISPAGMAVFEQQLYVVDRGNSRIQVFNKDGGFVRAILPPADNCGFLCLFEGSSRGRARDTGLWIDRDGNLYISEASKGQLLILTNSGAFLGQIGEFGSTPGQLRVPGDMVIDSCGRVFVSSAANGRVDMFGLPGYEDVEQFVPGKLAIEGESVNPNTIFYLTLFLELPGQKLDEVSNIIANGIYPPVHVEQGDFDRDTLPDLALYFAPEVLAASRGSESATLTVEGDVAGLRFKETLLVDLTVTDVDEDDDGVNNNIDQCPSTSPASPVDAEGCSPQQLCPCETDSAGQAWRNHGRYMKCIKHTLRQFERDGLITNLERGKFKREAAHSSCGKDLNKEHEKSERKEDREEHRKEDRKEDRKEHGEEHRKTNDTKGRR